MGSTQPSAAAAASSALPSLPQFTLLRANELNYRATSRGPGGAGGTTEPWRKKHLALESSRVRSRSPRFCRGALPARRLQPVFNPVQILVSVSQPTRPC